MSSVIVAAPPAYGECAPLLQLAQALVERGHEVTALVGSSFADAAAATGARFSPLRGAADFGPDVLADAARQALPPGPDQLNWDHTNVFVGALADQHAALQELLEADPDAALLSNALFVGAWPVALGAPGRRPRRWVAVVANPVVAGDDAATALGPVPGLDGPELVAANRAANAQFEAMFEPTRIVAQRGLDALGATGQLPPYISSWYVLPDAVAALTVAEFDFPRTTPPAELHYAGILPIRSAADVEPPSWWDELGSGKPVVVVTQGTAANNDLGALVEPTLRALADRDVLVVAALGRDVTALSMEPPANARIASYIPFDTLLPHADVLVTNGGFGGTQHALAHGVPVVVAGETEDKPMVAARVSYHGVGIDLGTQNPTDAQVAQAITAVLHEPSYRSAAVALSNAYDVDPVTTVEALLR